MSNHVLNSLTTWADDVIDKKKMHNKFSYLWTEVNHYQTEILKILRQKQNEKYEENI